MAPKKKEVQKLSLNEFMNDNSFGGGGSNWADEVEETYGTQPLPASDRRGAGGGSTYGSGFGGSSDRYAGYARQEREFPQELPTKPPYTAHLGNLSYDATQESVTDFFAGCEVVSVRIVEDRAEMRPKGFGYAEFATVDGLKKALELEGQSFEGRNIRIRIADPPKDRHGNESTRDFSDWSRKGPLAPEPPRNDRRGPRDFNEPRAPRDGPGDDSRAKDISWERKGPLMPLSPPPIERGGSRGGGSRSRTVDSERGDSFRDRRASPWGPGEGRQDGSRPPRREFVERPERAPTAAESNNQWRSAMRPDPPAQSPVPSRPASEAPSSPALAPAAPAATGGRPKLNLAKRTVSEAPGVLSPSLTSDSKASPFGAARPIDTAARERLIEEKHQQALKEKKEAEEKAKEERRLAKEAAEKEAAEKEVAEKEAAEKAAAEKEAAPATSTNGDAEKTDAPGNTEAAQDAAAAGTEKTEDGENAADPSEKGSARAPAAAPSRAVESGNWRQSTGERGGRGGFSGRGERRGGGGPRGGRGFDERQPSRGSRGYEERQFSRGGGRGLEERQPSRRGGEPSTPTTPTVDEDGWTTVSGAAKNRRGRPVAS
ncbi:Eukaryotic translation initiation factor 4B [Diaporthe eres]|uniref:Eukaryotic translation initiation factor 4B n=1 Tax=Diaporthe eres TaxID=83184 RepID=A0ABR1NQE6_DIAER